MKTFCQLSKYFTASNYKIMENNQCICYLHCIEEDNHGQCHSEFVLHCFPCLLMCLGRDLWRGRSFCFSVFWADLSVWKFKGQSLWISPLIQHLLILSDIYCTVRLNSDYIQLLSLFHSLYYWGSLCHSFFISSQISSVYFRLIATRFFLPGFNIMA